MEKIKVVVVRPCEAPEVLEIDATLESYQQLVGGYIECVYPFKDRVGLVCNEEGKLRNLPPNRCLTTPRGRVLDVVAGTFFIVGLGEEDFISLTDDLAEKYTALFAEPDFTMVCDCVEVMTCDA